MLDDAKTLVVAHGNMPRALVATLKGLSPAEVEGLTIATNEILVSTWRPMLSSPAACTLHI